MSVGLAVPDVLAAVDLGSNSFHMVVARYSHGQLVILDRLREMVRLAAGLSDGGRLDEASTDRALRCLERFGQRLRATGRGAAIKLVGPFAARSAWLRLALAFEIKRHGSADEIFQGCLIDLFAFVDVDGAPDIPIEAGVE